MTNCRLPAVSFANHRQFLLWSSLANLRLFPFAPNPQFPSSNLVSYSVIIYFLLLIVWLSLHWLVFLNWVEEFPDWLFLVYYWLINIVPDSFPNSISTLQFNVRNTLFLWPDMSVVLNKMLLVLRYLSFLSIVYSWGR